MLLALVPIFVLLIEELAKSNLTTHHSGHLSSRIYSITRQVPKTRLIIFLGWPKEELEKLVGSHWTLKVWNDGNLWGGHMTCREHPAFNCFDVVAEGVEKTVDHPLFGGKAKVGLSYSNCRLSCKHVNCKNRMAWFHFCSALVYYNPAWLPPLHLTESLHFYLLVLEFLT